MAYALEIQDIHKVFNRGTINEKVALNGVTPRYDRRRGTAGTGRCLQAGGDQSAPVHLPVPEPFQREQYLPRLRQ